MLNKLRLALGYMHGNLATIAEFGLLSLKVGVYIISMKSKKKKKKNDKVQENVKRKKREGSSFPAKQQKQKQTKYYLNLPQVFLFSLPTFGASIVHCMTQ